MRWLYVALIAVVAWMMPGVVAAEQVVVLGFPATLIEPADPRSPVVMFIAGSGPTDRDGNSRLGVSASYFAKLAAELEKLGVGSFRFDKRGVPGSLPVAKEADVTFETFAADAMEMFVWLKRHIGPRSLIVLGHSEGGLLALAALALAAERPETAAGVVLVATPGLLPADTLRKQLQALDEPLRRQALAIVAEIEAGRQVADVPETLVPLFRPSVQPFLRSLFALRPAEELARMDLPVLLIGGGTDLQVGRADFDALVAARPDAESRWFDGMNHILVDAPAERTGNLATYADPYVPLTPGLADAIADFAKRQ